MQRLHALTNSCIDERLPGLRDFPGDTVLMGASTKRSSGVAGAKICILWTSARAHRCKTLSGHLQTGSFFGQCINPALKQRPPNCVA